MYWNETQELLLLVCDEQAFILKYDKDKVDAAIAEDSVSPELGVPGAGSIRVTVVHFANACMTCARSMCI